MSAITTVSPPDRAAMIAVAVLLVVLAGLAAGW